MASPNAKNSKGKPSRRPRLRQVGQVPHSFAANGLSAPPTTPLDKPYSFREPSTVNVAPTTAEGDQSAMEIMAMLLLLGMQL